MNAPELASVRAKIGRAEHHLRDIDSALRLLIGSDPSANQPVIFDYESDGKEIIVKLAGCEPIDPALPLMIGDCLHNLRSALDHLVYQLALKNGAPAISANKTFFPIYLTKSDFDDRVKKLVKPFISSTALAEIEKCQPYSAYDVPSEADVWILNKLDIFDKHRLLVVAGQQCAPTEFTLTIAATGQQRHEIIPEPKWKPVENGTEIIRFRFAENPGKMRVQIKLVTTIRFINTGLASDGVAVQDALRQCIGIVCKIVSDFGKEFFGAKVQVMASANLLHDGDVIEKATSPFLRDFSPHYETFWQTHIVPLRSDGSIHPRRGIDEDFEFLAMQHYSLFVNLGNAYSKIIAAPGTPSANLGFPDNIYAMLHRTAELAVKVVVRFKKIFHRCTGKKIQVDTSKIRSLMEKITIYRNLIHQEFPAVQVDAMGRLRIPRAEKLEEYSRWTDVLYRSRSEDFVEVGSQLVNDFRTLCSALEATWKNLCEFSKQLSENKLYLEKRAQGESVPIVSLSSPSASGRIIISSNVVSDVVASPVAGVVFTLKP